MLFNCQRPEMVQEKCFFHGPGNEQPILEKQVKPVLVVPVILRVIYGIKKKRVKINQEEKRKVIHRENPQYSSYIKIPYKIFFILFKQEYICYKKARQNKKEINAKKPKICQWNDTEIVVEQYHYNGNAAQNIKAGIMPSYCIAIQILHINVLKIPKVS